MAAHSRLTDRGRPNHAHMGRGIAALCALRGYSTAVYEADPAIRAGLRGAIEESWQRAVARGKLSAETRRRLATIAFSVTAAYESVISRWFQGDDGLPETFVPTFDKELDLPYGENPQQGGAYYAERGRRNADGSPARRSERHHAHRREQCRRDCDGLRYQGVRHARQRRQPPHVLSLERRLGPVPQLSRGRSPAIPRTDQQRQRE